MYQNYYQPSSQQPTPTYRPIVPPMTLRGRPVASLEEARANAIDFDGTVFYFPDLANKRIYTKQINMDGSATLLMYELRELPQEVPASFVTREEFETVIKELKAALVAPTTSAAPAPDYKF